MKGLLLCLLILTRSTHLFSAETSRTSDDNLTFKLATQRKTQVKDISYKLYFELQKNTPEFEGTATLLVELLRTDLPLSLDLVGAKISQLNILRIRMI